MQDVTSSKKFTLLWKDGTQTTIHGPTLAKAMAANGLGISTIINMDRYIVDGNSDDYIFQSLSGHWIKK